MSQAQMSCACGRHPLLCIIPPYMLEHMADSSNAKVRKAAMDAIDASADARATRRVMREMPAMAVMAAPSAAKKHRLVYDAQNKGMPTLPGKLVQIGSGTGAMRGLVRGTAIEWGSPRLRQNVELEVHD